MKIESVQLSSIVAENFRLDPQAFANSAILTRKRIISLPHDALQSLTMGLKGGIFTHMFSPKRTYVDDPSYGIPFLGASSMRLADLSTVRLLSNRDAESKSYKPLTIREGMTLISCSGSVGEMVYARAEMDGMRSAGDILKVQPDPNKIMPGYLYAYLSSSFGSALVNAGTYGAIIQHIEPEHIADLPVPRFGDQLEHRVHRLVQQAAEMRSIALQGIKNADVALVARLALPPLKASSVAQFSTATVRSSSLKSRFDAPYHCRAASDADAALAAGRFPKRRLIEVLSRYFKPPMFKRLWVNSSEYGRQFVSGVDAYRFQAETIRYVSNRTPKFDEFILKDGMVIFQAAGQISGLFGRPLLVVGWLEDLFAADDLYRLVPQTLEDSAYLYGFFRTPHGQVLLKRQACGNSIPRIWDPQIRDVFVPWPDEGVRAELGAGFLVAHRQIEEARRAEDEALSLVERAIEGVG